MRERLIKVVDHYTFLKPELTTTSDFNFSYIEQPSTIESSIVDSEVPYLDVEICNIKLKSYVIQNHYAEMHLEEIILIKLYEQFNNHIEIFNIRDAHILNLDTRQEGASKLDNYLYNCVDKLQFPDMIIISQTLFEYLESSLHFIHLVTRYNVDYRLTHEGEYRGLKVYVDWFTKDDFLYIGNNRTSSVRLFYSFRNQDVIDLAIWSSKSLEQNFISILTKLPHDPMDINMLKKNVKQFFPR